MPDQPAPPPPTPVPAPPAPAAEAPPTLRRFGDHAATRQAVYDNALAAVQALPPAENSRYRLSLSDVGYAGPPGVSLAEHKAALLEGRTLARRMTGVATLTDKASGAVVDTRRLTLAAIPKLTGQGVFVLDGTGSPVSHQLRLLPGVYTRRRSSGEVESHVNLLPGTGVPHRVVLDPETGVFKATVGQAEIPALPLLRALGATDDELKAAWGGDARAAALLARNVKAAKPHHLDKLWEKFGPPGPTPDGLDKRAALAERLEKYPLDPWVTGRTLGAPHARYGKAPLLAATGKLLRVARGEADPDDRDHPAFSSVWGPEHLLAERLARSGPVLSKALWQATNAGHLRRLTPGLLTPSVRALFTKSGLALAAEGVSAAEFLDHGARITKVGEGGIGRSAESIPMASREVSAGQFPFIDLVRTSECFDPETEVMTRQGWVRWPDVTETTEFACLLHDQLQFRRAERLYAQDYTGPMYGVKTKHLDYLVTPTHRFWVRPNYGGAEYRWMTAEEVHGRGVLHQSAGHDARPGDGASMFTLPTVAALTADVAPDESTRSSRRRLGDRRLTTFDPFQVAPFAELLGWYLGEGSTRIREDRGRNNCYTTVISQSMTRNRQKCERIAVCLAELGLHGKYYASTRAFLIASKQLTLYVSQFGYSNERWIPEEFLDAPVEARQRLFDALLLAEGTLRKSGMGYGTFSTTSPRLAGDFVRLAFSLGYSTARSIHTDKRAAHYLPMHLVTIHSRTERLVHPSGQVRRGRKREGYYTVDYTGKVYCATVPGGKLYVRRNGSCGFWSGNSESVGTDLRVSFGTRLGSDRRLYAPVRDAKTGRIVYQSPRDLADAVLAFPGGLASPDPQVPVIRGGRLTYAPREEVTHVVPSMEQGFSPLTNLVPFKSAAKAQRSSMASRMIAQALPLVSPEAPLVRTQVPGQPGRSFEELYGRHMGPVYARPDAAGTVEAVAPAGVTVRYADGRRETHELLDHMPSGRKTAYHSVPLVRPGDSVAPGQLLARSNYTDDRGHAAYGANLRVAYMLDRGNVFEDSISVSRSAADRLRSEHLYHHQVTPDENTLVGKAAHAAAFGGKHTLAVLKTVGDDGVVRPGTVVAQGDPLILAVRRKPAPFGRLSRSAGAGLTDASEVWEHPEPGVVTDVVRGRDGPVVMVKTHKALQPGDKLCYDAATEVLTTAGWIPVPAVTPAHRVASLNPDGRLEYLNPVAVHTYPHTGRMYRLETTQVSLCVTPDHHLYARPRGEDEFSLIRAESLYGSRFELCSSAIWEGTDPTEIELPGSGYVRACGRGGRGVKAVPPVRMKVETYLMLLGTFLTDGYTIYDPDAGNYGLGITQVKPGHRARLKVALSAAGIKFVERPDRFLVYNRGLAEHLRPLGKTPTKYIPEFVFDYSPRLLAVLREWMMWGNGTETDTLASFCTGSRRLAGDFQRLCLHLGTAARVKVRPAADQPDTVKGVPVKTKSDSYYVYQYRHKLTPEINHGHSRRQTGQAEAWEEYTGTVYCVTLPRNHVLYVRRNGKAVWCGNSGRHGNKGTVVVVPDHQMPVAEDGRPVDVILSSLGVISRANPAQVYEAILGKVAAKTGRPYAVQDFDDSGSGRDVGQWVRDEAARHGVEYKETLTDPQTGRKIPGVGVGVLYLMKLHHIAGAKVKGRGLGGYDETGQPLRGQTGRAMRSSLGDTNALLSAGACFMGATHVLTDRGEMEIAAIVNNRLPVNVACTGDDGVVVFRPVTNWFCRVASPDELVRVETTARAGTGSLGGRSLRHAIRCTTNHAFYTSAGKVRAADLQPGDRLLTPGTALSTWQVQLLIGSLMGDSYGPCSRGSTGMSIADPDSVKPKAKARGGVRMLHGDSQKPYLFWKAEKISNLWGGHAAGDVGGFSNTVRYRIALRKHPTTDAVIEEFYPSGKKIVPFDVVRKMGWYGIGIWFADDGSCVCPKGTNCPTSYRFFTNGFTVEDVRRLAVELSDFCGLPWDVIIDRRGHPVLALNKGGRGGDQLDAWAAAIAPYIPPMMGYKIRDRFPVGGAWVDRVAPTRQALEEVRVVNVQPYEKAKHESYVVYDITVDEHHNYFAGGVKVSNSEVIRDAHVGKGLANPEFWQAYMQGYPPPKPNSSPAFDRWLTELRAAGVDTERRDGRYHLMALTDRRVRELAGDRELRNGETLDFSRNGEPVPGGLHDTSLFGGPDGRGWAKITLHEPLVNPAMEDPARRLLGLTEREFRDAVAGRHALPTGTGPAAVAAALRQIDVGKELVRTRAQTRSARKTARDEANRRLAVLVGLERTGQSPGDWVLTAAPVLPPAYRPVSPGGRGNVITADANFLYRDLLDANTALKELAGHTADVGAERLNLYDALKAVVGLGDPVGAKNRERGVKGILARVLGDSSKRSFLQQKLLGTPINLSGRAQALPNPDLDMDQIGVPEGLAWEMYHPFVVRRLVRQGIPRAEVARLAETRSPAARDALLEEMRVRPVTATRYPALHRYAVQGFRPVLVPGDGVHINHMVAKMYGGDYDGDAYTLSVPLGDAAVREVYEKLLPSRSLFNPATMKPTAFLPTAEYLAGLHYASTADDGNPPVEFATRADVIAARLAGRIGDGTRVRVRDEA